jgi:predicted protein tyrosine phosphatase
MMRQPLPLKVLFVCTYNMMRSVTAENMFRDDPMLDVKSAGIHPEAAVRVDIRLLDWADLVFVMEDMHKTFIEKMRDSLSLPDIINLNISDTYSYMDEKLMAVLRERIGVHLDDYLNSKQTSDSGFRC